MAGILASVFLGLTLVCIAFNVMHDACHGSYSGKVWINSVMGLTMNGLGSNAFIWKINNTRITKIDPGQYALFWASKLLYAFFYIGVPIYFLGWQPWLTGFLIIHFTMGLTLTVVFQLAHMVEKTTADFATGNRIISWLAGGLNFQIEHHLFPQISHVHYFALSKIVRQQCELFGLPYNCYPSAWQAIYSHIRLMKRLGNKHHTL